MIQQLRIYEIFEKNKAFFKSTVVARTTDRAAANYRNGRVTGVELVAQRVTSDMAYRVEVERFEAELGGSGQTSAFALRATLHKAQVDWHWDIAVNDQPAEQHSMDHGVQAHD